MGRYKVCVYAICKDEAQFARRWVASMSEADEIVVLDTGSKDGTPELLERLGTKVTTEVVSPWRFDTARNRSLEMVPEDADICVCTDLDEFFLPGWREKMEAAWSDSVKQLQYRYVWNFQPDGSEGYVFWIDKAHARHGFRWVNPVHEVLEWTGDGAPASAYAEGVQLEHHADPGKSRGQYLPLLELAVAENPENDRNMHYLGREYMFYRNWPKCIETLKRHLAMPTARWKDERCASMRYLARAWEEMGDLEQAESWLCRAVGEAPYLREPWLDLAKFQYRRGDWEAVVSLTRRALRIKERPRTYISEAESWGSLPYDLCALGLYYTGRYQQAAELCREALKRTPEDARLKENLRLMEEKAGQLP